LAVERESNVQKSIALMKALSQRGFARAGLLAIGAGTIVFAAGAWWLWKLHDEIIVQDVRKLQWQELKASEAVLTAAPVPSGWLGGVYLSGKAIDQVLKSQASTKLEVQNLEGFEDLTIQVRSIALSTQVGAPSVRIEAVATSEKRKLALAFQADGLLGYAGTSQSDDTPPKPMAAFAIALTSVQPKFVWSHLSFSTPALLREFVAAGVMKAVGERFMFETPISRTQMLSLGDPPAEGREEVKVRKVVVPIKETNGSVTLDARHKQADLTIHVNFATPLFSPQGVWLLATDKPFAPPVTEPPGKLTDHDLETLRSAVAKLHDPQPSPAGDAGFFLHNRGLVDLVGQISRLSEDQRTIYAKSVETKGRLYDTKWRDNVLGEGGIYIEAKGKDFTEISAAIAPPSVAWAPAKGVTLKSSATVHATAKLHWHFDPLVGGGFGNDVSIGGGGSVPVEGNVRVEMAEVGGESMALLVPTLICTNAPIEMKASGEIKLGVKTGVKLFDKPIAPTVLLDSAPRRIVFPVPKEEKAVDGQRKKVRVVPKWNHPAVDIVTPPATAVVTNEGFLVFANFASITPAKEKKDPQSEARKKVLAQKLAAYAEAMPAPTCPGDMDVRVTIGDIEIGPNGEVIKFTGEVVDFHKRVFEEGKKIITNPGAALRDAPDNIRREVKKACRRIWSGC
jgi:hypothetical protein